MSPGLLKFCTVGFCGIGTLIDFLLIAMQVSVTVRCFLFAKEKHKRNVDPKIVVVFSVLRTRADVNLRVDV